MRIFVAGATGVIGRRVVAQLLAAGHTVTALARSDTAAALLAKAGAEPALVSLFDLAALQAAMAGHHAVVNMATAIPTGKVAGERKAWEANHRIRREGATTLADAALSVGATRLVQESIALLYADGGDRLLEESAAVAPTWITASALDAEGTVARYSSSGGSGVVLRFGQFYGPDSAHSLDAIAAVRSGEPPDPAPASAYRSPITTDDAAAAVVAALAAPPGVYNVADDAPLRQQDYIDALAAALGTPPPAAPRDRLELPPDFEMLTRSQRVSSTRFKEATPWRPRFASAWEGWRAVAATLADEMDEPRNRAS